MVFFEISEPGIVIFVIAVVLGLVSTLVIKLTMGKEAKEAREKQKTLSKELKAALKANDQKKAKQLQNELMTSALSSMRFSLKPMLITFIPFILVFWWMMLVYGTIGDVNFEMDLSNQNLSIFDCPLQSEQSEPNQQNYCNSSYYNGTLKAGHILYFSIIVAPTQAPKTEVNIYAHAKDVDGKNEYFASASTVTVINGEPEKSPLYQKERNLVEITPKFISNSTNGNMVKYNFKLINHNVGKVVTLFGIDLSWLWWYLLVALPFSLIAGRLLKLY